MPTGEFLASGYEDAPHARDAAALTDLTLIFNAHETVEQARDSTAHVPPDSLVFLEGLNVFGPDYAFMPYVNDLTGQRLHSGKSDTAYNHNKQVLLEAISDRLKSFKPTGSTDFMAHMYAELHSLISKDCAIAFADYVLPDEALRGGEAAREHQDFVRRNDLSRYDNTPHIWPFQSLRRRVGLVEQSVGGFTLSNFQREHMGANTMLSAVWEASQAPAGNEMLRNDDGRFAAYATYGSRHRLSLTSEVERHDISVREIHLTREHDAEYFDPVEVDGQSGDIWCPNFRRRVGYAMLRRLAVQTSMGLESGLDYANRAYGKLEWLNGAGDDEYRQFVCDVADATRAIIISPRWGERKFSTLIDDHLADIPLRSEVDD